METLSIGSWYLKYHLQRIMKIRLNHLALFMLHGLLRVSVHP